MPLFYLKISIYHQLINSNIYSNIYLKVKNKQNRTPYLILPLMLPLRYIFTGNFNTDMCIFIILFYLLWSVRIAIIFTNIYKNQEIEIRIVMTHFAPYKLAICIVYGVISLLQTLNSRYLYRNLGFDFYSFVFGIQRIIIIFFFYAFTEKRVKTKILPKILPYSFFMCLSNILSSYCITIMPLAAFLSFKKFIVLFILGLTVSLKLPNQTNHFQNLCIVGIVLGGAMVGQKDLLHGNVIGYISCLAFNLSQAIILQYSNYLYRHDGLEPEQLLLHNCTIGFPYYLGVLAYEAEFDDIFYYFKDKFSLVFLAVMLLSVILACISELSASYIAMKISPFEKSTVANIKDLVLMIFSVSYFYDFTIGPVSGIGIVLCLISSILFSLPYLQQKDPVVVSISPQQTGQQAALYEDPSPKLQQAIATQHHLSQKQQQDLIFINMSQVINNKKQQQIQKSTV